MSTRMVTQESTLPALRILLGVTEVTQVQQLTDKLNDMPRLMKAYHFQQSMKQFADAWLKMVNATLEEDESPQTLAHFEGKPHEHDTELPAMVFVNPDLDEESYILGQGYDGRDHGDKFFLNSLEDIAAYRDLDPENFDHLLHFCYAPEDRYYEEDAPHDGILFIGLRD